MIFEFAVEFGFIVFGWNFASVFIRNSGMQFSPLVVSLAGLGSSRPHRISLGVFPAIQFFVFRKTCVNTLNAC